MNNILDIYDKIKDQLSVTGLTVCKEVKPSSETANCIVLSSVPIKKNNVNSIDDLIIFVYLQKIQGYFDFNTAKVLLPQIENLVQYFCLNTLSCPTEKNNPDTINYNDIYTVSRLTYRIINF